MQLFGQEVKIVKGNAQGFRCKVCALRKVCTQLSRTGSITKYPCDTKTGEYQYFKPVNK